MRRGSTSFADIIRQITAPQKVHPIYTKFHKHSSIFEDMNIETKNIMVEISNTVVASVKRTSTDTPLQLSMPCLKKEFENPDSISFQLYPKAETKTPVLPPPGEDLSPDKSSINSNIFISLNSIFTPPISKLLYKQKLFYLL